MNRNMMYNLLNETDLVSRFIYYKNRKGYHTRFRYENWEIFNIDLGCCYVRGVCEIALCTNEIVLLSKYDGMKVNIKYSNIMKVEINRA